MKAGIKVVSSGDAISLICCSEPTANCHGSTCMAWIAVGGFKCGNCEGLNIDQIKCCKVKMDINTEGSCGMVGP